ncbi:hypothetical protein Rs2_45744 [Raphanus sativus]|nr:hypothetical protein Rs2_45744 [Raphanus sativus]
MSKDKTKLQQKSISSMKNISQRNVHSSVAISSVFKRIFHGLDPKPVSEYNNVIEALTTKTPTTPKSKRRCVKGVNFLSNNDENTPLQRSCLTSLSARDKTSAEKHPMSNPNHCLQRNKKRPAMTDITNIDQTHFTQEAKDVRSTEAYTRHFPNKRKQRHNKNSVEDVITSIDFNLENDLEKTSSKTSGKLHNDDVEGDEEEMNDYDLDYEGIIEEIDADLEFDVSSIESTDSENDDSDLDVSNVNITNQCRNYTKRKTKPLKKSSMSKSRGI